VLIAYLTTDEVNQDLAARMADECGAALVILSPRDPLPDGQFDAAIYDLDYVPPALRDEILAKLLCGPRLFPVAVHSYNLIDGQIEALFQKNVSVYCRLDRGVFLNLALAWRLSRLPAGQRSLRPESQPGSHGNSRQIPRKILVSQRWRSLGAHRGGARERAPPR